MQSELGEGDKRSSARGREGRGRPARPKSDKFTLRARRTIKPRPNGMTLAAERGMRDGMVLEVVRVRSELSEPSLEQAEISPLPCCGRVEGCSSSCSYADARTTRGQRGKVMKRATLAGIGGVVTRGTAREEMKGQEINEPRGITPPAS